MKVFVWKEFSPSYFSGLAVAIAESEEEAMKIVSEVYAKDVGLPISNWGLCEVHELDKPMAFCIPGAD